MDNCDIGWAAGLFEGEGFFIRPIPPGRNRGMELRSKDEDVVRRFHEIVGIGVVAFVLQKGIAEERTSLWRWKCTRWYEVEPLIQRFLPYLGARRRQRALEMLENAPDVERSRRVAEGKARV